MAGNILSKIVKHKKQEVAAAKKKTPMSALLAEIMKLPANRNFRDVFENNDFTIVGEIKKKSPSKGVIKGSVNIKNIVQIYEKAGIKALSIVTDKKFFDGNLEYIKEAKKHCSMPVLRKDFVIDEYQIYETRAARADAILLIAAILEKRELASFIRKARFLNVTPVVECVSKEEIKKAAAAGAEIIGINARDLKTFKINLARVKTLVKYVPKDKFVMCESGINTPEDVDEIMVDAKIKGVLIGTMFMKAKGEKQIKDLAGQILNKYGN
jgi:indole-3-glycerol phosphate synthase